MISEVKNILDSLWIDFKRIDLVKEKLMTI